MKTNIYTLTCGEKGLYNNFLPSQRAFAERSGCEYIEWDEAIWQGPNPKFTVIKMMESFLESDADVFYFIDADIWVELKGEMPKIPDYQGWLLLSEEKNKECQARWKSWELDIFNKESEDFIYRNTGVILGDREGIKGFLALTKGVEWHNSIFLEQNHFNTWFAELEKTTSIKVEYLPENWNALEMVCQTGDFVHFAGGDKDKRFNNWINNKRKGFVDGGRDETKDEEVWIVYPLKQGGSKWSDWEIRLSIRSIERNWRGRLDGIVILGKYVPDWIDSEKIHFRLSVKYKDALIEASKLGGRVIWMNDDISFLKPTGIEDLQNPRQQGRIGWRDIKNWANSNNSWRRRKASIGQWLGWHGYTRWDYSTHTPYLYDTKRMSWLLKNGPWFGYKTAFETLYFNYFHGDNYQKEKETWRPHSKIHIPEDWQRYRFWNLTDSAVGSDEGDRLIRGYCRGVFSEPSQYEK